MASRKMRLMNLTLMKTMKTIKPFVDETLRAIPGTSTCPSSIAAACISSVAISFACTALPAFAQVRPDAGSTQRDLDQRPLDVPRARPPLSTEPARPALKVDESTRFAVTAVTVSGNSAFDSAT